MVAMICQVVSWLLLGGCYDISGGCYDISGGCLTIARCLLCLASLLTSGCHHTLDGLVKCCLAVAVMFQVVARVSRWVSAESARKAEPMANSDTSQTQNQLMALVVCLVGSRCAVTFF